MRPRRGACARCNLFAETIAAVEGAVATGLKGHPAGLAALGANSVEHGTLTAAVAGVALTSNAAGLAPLGLVGKALLCEKLLLAGSKGELLAAILANHGLVLKHVIPL